MQKQKRIVLGACFLADAFYRTLHYQTQIVHGRISPQAPHDKYYDTTFRVSLRAMDRCKK